MSMFKLDAKDEMSVRPGHVPSILSVQIYLMIMNVNACLDGKVGYFLQITIKSELPL